MFAAAPILCVTVFGEDFRGSTDDAPHPRLRPLSAIVALKLFGSALVAQGRPLLQTAAIGAGLRLHDRARHRADPAVRRHSARRSPRLTTHTLAGAVVAAIFLRVVGGSPRDLVPRASDLTWFASGVRRPPIGLGARRVACPGSGHGG